LEFNVPFQHKYGYIRDARGLKFTLVLVAELEKPAANVEQVYDENIEPQMIRTTAYF